MSSKFGKIRPRTAELAALGHLKKFPMTFNGNKTSSRFLSCFYQILFILAGNEDMHDSLDEFEFWPDSRTDYGVNCP